MRLLLMCLTDLSVSTGSPIRARLLIDGFLGFGWEVATLSTGAPHVSHLRLNSFVYRWDENLSSSIKNVLENYRPDIVLGVTEAGIDSLCRETKALDIPVILDIHGLGFVEILELGSGYGSRILRCWNSLRWLSGLPKADAIFALSPTLLPILKKFNKNTYFVNGMTDISFFHPEGEQRVLGKNADRIKILYAGNFYKWQGVDLLIDAIDLVNLQSDKFEFIFIGPCKQNFERVELWKNKLKFNNVFFYDSVDYYEMPAYLRGADVLIIPRPFMLSSYLAVPQKMGDCLASGRTIIASDLKSHRHVLGANNSGILCSPNAKKLAQAILSTTDSDLRVGYADRARQEAEDNFCHKKLCKAIHEIFLGILGRKLE